LLDYAINDVLDLFTIEREIAERLCEANRYETYLKESAALTQKNYVIDHLQHYKAKFPGYKNLNPEKRGKAAVAWVFRELMGKHFDCPVGYILSKHALAAAIADHENMQASLERELNRGRSTGKRVTKTLVEKCFNEALRISGNRP
jgi:ribonuclease D